MCYHERGGVQGCRVGTVGRLALALWMAWCQHEWRAYVRAYISLRGAIYVLYWHCIYRSVLSLWAERGDYWDNRISWEVVWRRLISRLNWEEILTGSLSTETTIGLASAYYLSGILDDSWNVSNLLQAGVASIGEEEEEDNDKRKTNRILTRMTMKATHIRTKLRTNLMTTQRTKRKKDNKQNPRCLFVSDHQQSGGRAGGVRSGGRGELLWGDQGAGAAGGWRLHWRTQHEPTWDLQE